MAAYKPWRQLAEQIAAAGCPTLRFDYSGDGDSADPDVLQISDWVASIRRAVRYLREEAGAEEIVLVGLRLGGTLAAIAAQEEAIDRLVLMAPFTTGQTYLREMRFRAQSIGRLADGSTPTQDSHRLTVGGFALERDLLDDLRDINLLALERKPARHVLVLTTQTCALASRYAALGSEVTTAPFIGLGKLIGDPILAESSVEDFERIVAFVSKDLRLGSTQALRGSPRATPISGPGWSEEPAQLGSGLFGIFCTPRQPSAVAPAVLFISTGVTVRSGWGRQTTVLARKLAREGILSLRLDLRGIGDSQTRADGTLGLYAPDTLDDVRLAVQSLIDRGAGPIVLVGTCSGAYAAFKALCHDTRVGGALLINLYCFDWDPDQHIDVFVRRINRSASGYAALLRKGSTWGRLLRGQIQVRAKARALVESKVRSTLRRLTQPLEKGLVGGSVGQRIAKLRGRGAHIRLLYSEDDPGLAAVRRHIGRSAKRVAGVLGAPIEVIPAADHHLSTCDAQDRAATQLRALLQLAMGQGLRASAMPHASRLSG